MSQPKEVLNSPSDDNPSNQANTSNEDSSRVNTSNQVSQEKEHEDTITSNQVTQSDQMKEVVFQGPAYPPPQVIIDNKKILFITTLKNNERLEGNILILFRTNIKVNPNATKKRKKCQNLQERSKTIEYNEFFLPKIINKRYTGNKVYIIDKATGMLCQGTIRCLGRSHNF